MVSTVWSTDFTEQRNFQSTSRHIYFIRRVIVLVILISVIFTGALVVNAFHPADSESKGKDNYKITKQSVNRVIVEPGMSLWTIASQYKPKGVSTRAYINYLMKVNQLESPSIQLGDVILVP